MSPWRNTQLITGTALPLPYSHDLLLLPTHFRGKRKLPSLFDFPPCGVNHCL